jgi:hypothetical protein
VVPRLDHTPETKDWFCSKCIAAAVARIRVASKPAAAAGQGTGTVMVVKKPPLKAGPASAVAGALPVLTIGTVLTSGLKSVDGFRHSMPCEDVLEFGGESRAGWWVVAVTLMDNRRGEVCATSLAAQNHSFAAIVARAYTQHFARGLLPSRGCDVCLQAPCVRCPTSGCPSALCDVDFRTLLPPGIFCVDISPEMYPPHRVAQYWTCSACTGLRAAPVPAQRSLFVLLSAVYAVAGDKEVTTYEHKKLFSLDSDKVAATHEVVSGKSFSAVHSRALELRAQVTQNRPRRDTFVHIIYMHGSGFGTFSGATLQQVANYIADCQSIATAVQAKDSVTIFACCDVAASLQSLFSDHVTTQFLGFAKPFGHRSGWTYLSALMDHIVDGGTTVAQAIVRTAVYPISRSLQPFLLNFPAATVHALSAAHSSACGQHNAASTVAPARTATSVSYCRSAGAAAELHQSPAGRPAGAAAAAPAASARRPAGAAAASAHALQTPTPTDDGYAVQLFGSAVSGAAARDSAVAFVKARAKKRRGNRGGRKPPTAEQKAAAKGALHQQHEWHFGCADGPAAKKQKLHA